MVRILVCDKLANEGIEILKESGFEVEVKTDLDKDSLKKIIKGYQALVIRSQTKVTQDIIEAAENLKVIGRAGVGLDNVDVSFATKKGIIVMNAPGGNTISTCEHTFALILSLARKVPFAHMSLKRGEWKRGEFKGTELYGKTLGIIGLGRIGKEVAKRAISFGMNVIGYDPYIAPDIGEKLGVEIGALDDLLRNSDVITVHSALTEDTRNLINKDKFSLMKPTVYLVNCARGGIVDEGALSEALKQKRIAGAALDVFSKEPPEDFSLIQQENLITTPHLGASTEEAQVNVAVEIAHCIRDALSGKAMRNAVNYVQIEPEVYKTIHPYIGLAEKMGRFISQLIQGVHTIKISFIGEIAGYKVDPISMAAVKGFLATTLEEEVHFINAFDIARERGITVEQIKVNREEEYVNSLRIVVKAEKEQKILEGTLFANKEPRFVKMDDCFIEIAPSPYMLVINNWDRPGVIGYLGTILGKHGINIANMSLGRKDPEGVAITVLNVDTPLDQKVEQEILSHADIISLKSLKV